MFMTLPKKLMSLEKYFFLLLSPLKQKAKDMRNVHTQKMKFVEKVNR